MKTFLIIIIALVVGSIALNAWILTEVTRVKSNLSEQGKKITELGDSIKQGAKPAVAAAPTELPKVKVSIDDDPIKGDINAPVTVVEFSDYQCPFCKRNHTNVFPQLDKEYISTGKVRYVFRDYPLAFHKQAIPAAVAANCAGEQGKYWEINDYLFENPANLKDAAYLKFAEDNGLDLAKYKECLKDDKQKQEVDKDFKDGQRYGVRGTPSFFIGKSEKGKEMTGVYVRGARPYSVFKIEIDKVLASK